MTKKRRYFDTMWFFQNMVSSYVAECPARLQHSLQWCKVKHLLNFRVFLGEQSSYYLQVFGSLLYMTLAENLKETKEIIEPPCIKGPSKTEQRTHAQRVTFKSRARQHFGASLQRCDSPPAWAKELSNPSSDSARLLLEIEKKNRFSFSVWGSLEGPQQVGVFLLFLAAFTWPWTTTHWAIILAQAFWKLGQNPRL